MTKCTIALSATGFLLGLPTARAGIHEVEIEATPAGMRALRALLARHESEQQLASRGNPVQYDVDKMIAAFKREEEAKPRKPELKLSDGSTLDLSGISLEGL